MLFPVQVFPYNIICEIELLSHRMGFYWNVNTRQVYVSLMFRLPKITLLTVTVTFKQQPNFNSINICFFDWRTCTLDASGLLARQRRGASERVVLVARDFWLRQLSLLSAPTQSRCQLFLQSQDLTLGI